MIADFINRAFCRVSLRGAAQVRHAAHSYHGLGAVHCWPLDLDGYAGGEDEWARVGLDR